LTQTYPKAKNGGSTYSLNAAVVEHGLIVYLSALANGATTTMCVGLAATRLIRPRSECAAGSNHRRIGRAAAA
jgi:hypothetical protein